MFDLNFESCMDFTIIEQKKKTFERFKITKESHYKLLIKCKFQVTCPQVGDISAETSLKNKCAVSRIFIRLFEFQILKILIHLRGTTEEVPYICEDPICNHITKLLLY